jgi:integrase
MGMTGPAHRRSGLDRLHFHDLRHTYAALMIAAGANPKYLQAQMGQASIKVTLDTMASFSRMRTGACSPRSTS